MSLRGQPEWVGKGDCYSANFGLLEELIAAGEDAYLCHGVIVAADFYKHMKPGRRFMHAWVEANHPDHGWKVGDASLGELTFHPKKMFYDVMQPHAVVKMNIIQAKMNVIRHRKFGGWGLHPDHEAFA